MANIEICHEHSPGAYLARNADMGPAEIDQFCWMDDTGKQLMHSAMQQLAITARAFHRILKLGRTIIALLANGAASRHAAGFY